MSRNESHVKFIFARTPENAALWLLAAAWVFLSILSLLAVSFAFADCEAPHEINEIPGNVTLRIDGFDIAYPVKAEILARHQIPPAPFAKGEEGAPRYYILAEPILYRRAGGAEWRSLYEPEPLCPDYDFIDLKCKRREK